MKTLVFKAVFCALGAGLIVNALGLAAFSNMNAGLLAALALGAVFLLYGLFFKTVNRVVPGFVLGIIAAGIVAVVFLSVALFVFGSFDNVDFDEDAVIVLGSGIRGKKPTKNLIRRLDRAVEYYNQNPRAVIVVSGGQGPREDIAEAVAMEGYLVSKGVPKEKILREERATSTFENFTFSKEILDGYFDRDYSVAFVTNNYHVFRAKALSKKAGFDEAAFIHSSTPWYFVVPSALRECLAFIKMLVLGR